MKSKTTKSRKNQTNKLAKHEDAYYWDMVNEETGARYDIPMLNTLSPTYFWDYIHYMKLKERSPETFEKVIRWD